VTERAELLPVVEALGRLIGLVEGFAKGIEARGWALPEVTAEMYAETAKARAVLNRVVGEIDEGGNQDDERRH
jgi:hypothetical protein